MANFHVWMREENGDHLRYGPYSEYSAKSFARIGSQTGGPRAVTEGAKGPLIRVYAGGVRTFPKEL